MGWWKLKNNLNPHECLQIRLEDVEDFITWTTKDEQLTDVDREHIYEYIRNGYVEGEVNDWDREEIEAKELKH